MFKNPNFEVAFSDELHKIASAGAHDEALNMIKEGGPLLAKALKGLKTFSKNPLLRSQQGY